MNLKDYLFQKTGIVIYKPHGNHKSKIYNRYTKTGKEHKHTVKKKIVTNYREETKQRRTENYKNKQKARNSMVVSTN